MEARAAICFDIFNGVRLMCESSMIFAIELGLNYFKA